MPKNDFPRAKAIKKKRNLAKTERREKREQLGEDGPKQKQKTIENTREPDANLLENEDDEMNIFNLPGTEEEAVEFLQNKGLLPGERSCPNGHKMQKLRQVLFDTQTDTHADYFNRERTPKVLITTSPGAKIKTWKLCFELRKCIPNVVIVSRKNVAIKRIVKQAVERGFTDLLVVHEDRKKPNGIVISHLPEGPTAYFKINSLEYSKQIKGVGESTDHHPEVIANNFTTQLGHSVARMFVSLFPYDPQFTGRRVVTFHNQRDYIFFRHHRYEFKGEGEKAALLELGPRFTLRLKWVQKGTYDTRNGEYEWVYKRREVETSRRKFCL